MKIAFVYMNTEKNIGRGAGYIAGAVLEAGHALTFFDIKYTPVDKIIENIVKSDFDILMISTMTLLFPMAAKLVEQVKKRKKISVLLGGLHPTIIGPRLLKKYPKIDYLCIGEGESMVKDFLHHFGKSSLTGVKNLAFRVGKKVHCNPLRPPENLASSPLFPWHLFHKNSVVLSNGLLYTNATRGCPFSCSYCCNGIYLEKYGKEYIRTRPIAHVIAELKFLKENYNPRLFYFGDEMIFCDKRYALDLFTAMKEEKIGIPYGFMVRAEYMTPNTVKVLGKTNCKYVAMGIECGDEEFRRKYLKRNTSNEVIERSFQLCREAGIYTSSFNMIGYPFKEDKKLTESTIRINQKIKPDWVQVTIFHPFPGTELYNHCVKEELLDKERIGTTRYYKESVLKGYSLAGERVRIHKLLNGKRGFQPV